jgi:hypothetical protein
MYKLLYSVHVYCCTQLTWRYLCSDSRWLLCGGGLWVRPGGFGLTAVAVHPGDVVHGHEAVHTHPPPRVHKYLGITNNRKAHGPNIYEDTKPQMSSLLMFKRVYKLEILSVMLVFSTPLVN